MYANSPIGNPWSTDRSWYCSILMLSTANIFNSWPEFKQFSLGKTGNQGTVEQGSTCRVDRQQEGGGKGIEWISFYCWCLGGMPQVHFEGWLLPTGLSWRPTAPFKSTYICLHFCEYPLELQVLLRSNSGISFSCNTCEVRPILVFTVILQFHLLSSRSTQCVLQRTCSTKNGLDK